MVLAALEKHYPVRNSRVWSDMQRMSFPVPDASNPSHHQQTPDHSLNLQVCISYTMETVVIDRLMKKFHLYPRRRNTEACRRMTGSHFGGAAERKSALEHFGNLRHASMTLAGCGRALEPLKNRGSAIERQDAASLPRDSTSMHSTGRGVLTFTPCFLESTDDHRFGEHKTYGVAVEKRLYS
jgi:hypothetical protein